MLVQSDLTERVIGFAIRCTGWSGLVCWNQFMKRASHSN